jgi:hypothetical protein
MIGSLTLMGSGEFTPGMARIHRGILDKIKTPLTAYLDTPAGFELNHAAISAKAAAYFQDNFGLPLNIASFPNALDCDPLSMADCLRTLRQSNYIVAGPGSPTYAVKQWRDTPVFETVAAKLAAGAHLMFASAAALALGRWTIPVYEIYKVGDAPFWFDGLDLLGRHGLSLAVAPHWNNNSGGSHDTSHCFVGRVRFELLRTQLPAHAVVLGIDEYTSCTLDFDAQRGRRRDDYDFEQR